MNALENLTFDGKKIPVKYFDEYGASTKKPEFKKPIPAGVTAETVIDNYIKAIGGKDKLMKGNEKQYDRLLQIGAFSSVCGYITPDKNEFLTPYPCHYEHSERRKNNKSKKLEKVRYK